MKIKIEIYEMLCRTEFELKYKQVLDIGEAEIISIVNYINNYALTVLQERPDED